MNYQEAEKIRGKGFASTMTDKILGGQGIGQSFKSTVSEKSKATMKGIKQKFDPMNLAKKLTGGSKLGPALLGRMTGRSQEDIEFFAGKGSGQGKGPGKVGQSAAVSGVAIDFATEILGEIYKLLQQIEQDRTLTEELKHNKEKEEQGELDKRNQEIIAAITGRKKKEPTRREEARKKKEEVKRKKQEKREEGKKAETTKPEAKPSPKPEAKPSPKAEAKPSPKAEPVSTKPSLPSASKLAGGAAITAVGLGALSAKAESGKDGPAAVGWDSTGGTSYGTYQLSSKKGSIDEFLKFLDDKKPEWSQRLRSAGKSDTGSKKGDFPDAWRAIAKEDPKGFHDLQHEFIQKRDFDPTVKRLQKIGYDVNKQPPIVADVLWSTAVQHGAGGAYGIFSKVITELGPNVDADKLIKRVYEIRGTKFGGSTEQVRASVQKRFQEESSTALAKLSTEKGMTLETASKQNQQLKKDLNAQQAQSGTQRQTTNIKTTSTPQQSADVDDSSSYDKKRRSA